MFEVGERIVYGNIGICEITDIKKLDMQVETVEELYYIMRPFHDPSSQVFTPIDNNKIVMRKIMTKIEAENLIHGMSEIEIVDAENDKIREQGYKEALRSCDSNEWAKMLKILFLRKEERLTQGKKVSATDEKYLRMVQGKLYVELELALEISTEQITSLIHDKVTDIS